MMATPLGTRRYAGRFSLPDWAWCQVGELTLTSLGLGTYSSAKGLNDDEHAAVIASMVFQGCNVIDTAPNYRDGHSEAAVGMALKQVASQGISRDEIFISTKVGLPHPDLAAELGDLGPEGSCYRPESISISLNGSLNRLDIDSVDCVFIHNLEFLKMADPSNFQNAWTALAQMLDRCCEQGLCDCWGISSWSGFRVSPKDDDYLSLEYLMAGRWRYLKMLQVPLGLWGPEVVTLQCQQGKSLLENTYGLSVFANSPLLQGDMAQLLPDKEIIRKAICFSRDTEGVSSTLLGVSNKLHVAQWQDIQKLPPANTVKDLLCLMDTIV